MRAPCAADIDNNAVVNLSDLAALLSASGTSGKGLPEDIDGSGTVDLIDLAAFLADFGSPCL